MSSGNTGQHHEQGDLKRFAVASALELLIGDVVDVDVQENAQHADQPNLHPQFLARRTTAKGASRAVSHRY
jgi:hypothetical protein